MVCEIDYIATGAMMSGWGSLLGAIATAFGGIAVLVAANRAANTFTAWKQQKREERRMELAEQTLALAYKVKHAFAAIRSPASFGGEHDEARKKLIEGGSIREGQEDAGAKRLITAQIALLRLSWQQKTWDALAELTPTVKAVFGTSLSDRLEEFWRLQAKISSAAYVYSQFRPRIEATADERMEEMRLERDLERAFWAMALPDQPDEVADGVEAVIVALEAELAPIIRAGIA